jgi:adenosylmethionine-8-amino-7-oxononanoate aminotransferase
MAFQFWANQQHDGGGEFVNGKCPPPRRRQHFLCFDGGYHGDTIGAMSVGVGSGYHQPFRPMMFPVLTIPYVQTWQQRPLEEIERAEAEAMDILEGHLREYPEGIAALIIEPLVQVKS